MIETASTFVGVFLMAPALALLGAALLVDLFKDTAR